MLLVSQIWSLVGQLQSLQVADVFRDLLLLLHFSLKTGAPFFSKNDA